MVSMFGSSYCLDMLIMSNACRLEAGVTIERCSVVVGMDTRVFSAQSRYFACIAGQLWIH